MSEAMSARKVYEAFGRWAAKELSYPWMGGLDGGKCQDKLHELGILVCEKYDSEKHGDLAGDDEFEEGDDIFSFAEGMQP